MELPRDFREFLKLLNENEVEYMLVGGHAVALHGYPRYTADIDIWIAISRQNAEKIVKVLTDFGFGSPELSVEMFLDPDQMTRMGREPLKIEILNHISGVEFKDAIDDASKFDIGDVIIPVISLYHLRKNKAASGRGKDLLDLENLPEIGDE